MNSSLSERLSRISRLRSEARSVGEPDRKTTARGKTRSLESMLSGVEITMPSGVCFLHERPLSKLPDTDPAILERLRRRLDEPLAEDLARDPAVQLWKERGLDSAAFLDLETTGLGTGPIILAGVLACYEGEFRFRIYLARNYSEEAAMIEALAADLARRAVLVTYNGKSYDLPFLRERTGRLRIKGSEPPVVFDVLHAARRRWKGHYADLKLGTLERHLCHRQRLIDIPGRDIPAAYHRFVRNGNPTALIPILHHNLVDLYTLCEVAEHVLGKTETRKIGPPPDIREEPHLPDTRLAPGVVDSISEM